MSGLICSIHFIETTKRRSLRHASSALQGPGELARVEDALRDLDEQGGAGTDAHDDEPLVAGGCDHREEATNLRDEDSAHRCRNDAQQQDPLPGRQRTRGDDEEPDRTQHEREDRGRRLARLRRAVDDAEGREGGRRKNHARGHRQRQRTLQEPGHIATRVRP